MVISIFFLLLLIFQIIMLIKATKKDNKSNWTILLSTIILSILLVAILFGYSWINLDYLSWNALIYWIVCVVAVSAFTLILIVSVIIKLVKNKNGKKQDIVKDETKNQSVKTKTIVALALVLSTFFIALFLEDLPYKIQQRNDKITANEAKDEIIVYLNQRYGYGDFEIIDMYSCNTSEGASWLNSRVEDGYEFVVKTSYLKNCFKVSLTKDNFEVCNDAFLNTYYYEQLEISNLENYLKEYELAKINEALSQNFNVEIDFNNIFINGFGNEKYGHVPTIDELAAFVELHDPKININEDISTSEELLKYLIKLTKFYIKDLDTSNVVYSQTNKYFRYKYDYNKLGVNDYKDQYNGYGGYVLAGSYEFSEEKGHYIIKDENTIIRINIMGRVAEFNAQDILDN